MIVDYEAGAPTSWEQRIIINNGLLNDPRRHARQFKAIPHRRLPDADIWIWIDGNVRLLIPPEVAVSRWLQGDLAIFKHPDRSCLYDEAAFCAKVGKDSTDVLKKQVARYRKAKMPVGWGLPETRCMIRRNTEQMCELGERWWDELRQFSCRDQVSLPFVCWQMGVRWDVIAGRCYTGNTNEYFWYKKHRGK